MPSPFPPSYTQFPPPTPHMHMRMHRCPNTVSDSYPSPPSITPSTNQSSTKCLLTNPPPPYTHSTHLAPNLTSPTHPPHHSHSPHPNPSPKSPHAHPSPTPATRCTITPITAKWRARTLGRWRRAASAVRLKRTGFPSADSSVPCVERTSVD